MLCFRPDKSTFILSSSVPCHITLCIGISCIIPYLPLFVYSLRLIVLPAADTGFDWTACLGGHLSLVCRYLYHVIQLHFRGLLAS
jgi:hypothetical protein